MSVIESTPVTTPVSQRKPLMGGAYDLSGTTSVDEALRLAGLDWEPKLVDLAAKVAEGVEADVDSHRAVVHGGKGTVLGVVGSGYQMVGNRQLADFGALLVDEEAVSWHVGGSLNGGRLPFLQFKTPNTIQVAGMDEVETWVMLTNGLVGNSCLTSTVLVNRLACGNQVRSAKLANATYKIRHRGNVEAKIEEARRVLGISFTYAKEFELIANQLAEIDVDLSFFEDFVDELLPLRPEEGVRTNAAIARQRGTLRQNWHATETLSPELKATGWGALNVVTEVIDHGNLDVRKSKSDAEERRFIASMNGNGAKLRERAFELLLTEAEAPGSLAERKAERELALA